MWEWTLPSRAWDFIHLRSLGIDSKEQIPSAYEAWGGIFKLLRTPGIDSAIVYRLAGRYYNSIPTRFLAPIDCSKIPSYAKMENGVGSVLYYFKQCPMYRITAGPLDAPILKTWKAKDADSCHKNLENLETFRKNYVAVFWALHSEALGLWILTKDALEKKKLDSIFKFYNRELKSHIISISKFLIKIAGSV